MSPRSPRCAAGALKPGSGWGCRAALSLVAGLFVAVASAWVCAILPQPRAAPVESFTSADEVPAWHVQVMRAPWFTHVYTLAGLDDRESLQLSVPPPRAVAALPQEVPAWARGIVARPPTPEEVSSRRITTQTGVGWPFRSMYARGTLVPDSPPAKVTQGIDLRPLFGGPLDSRGRLRRYRTSSWMLPLRPIWPGFACNAGLVALVIFASWTGIIALQRRRREQRLARGVCPHCRYPLTDGATCPECGRPVSLHPERG